MITKDIKGEGITGLAVEFTNAELVVLKEFVNQLAEVNKETPKGEKRPFIRDKDMKAMIQKAEVLFGKMIPSHVMSIEDAEKALFEVPSEPDTDEVMVEVLKSVSPSGVSYYICKIKREDNGEIGFIVRAESSGIGAKFKVSKLEIKEKHEAFDK